MGYWNNQGATPTKVTWANPQAIPDAQKQSGGWYYNPSSGLVERWWAESMGEAGAGKAGATNIPNSMQSVEAKAEADRQAFQKSSEEKSAAQQSQLKAEEEGLLSSFQTKSAGQKPLSQAYQEYSNTAGVSALTGQLGTLRNEVMKVSGLLDQLEGDITSRTEGKLVSEAQRRRMLAAEEEPLRTQMGRLATGQVAAGQQLDTALNQVGTQLSVLNTEQQKELEPIRLRMSAFTDRAAREITAFDKTQESALSLLLDKISAGRTIAQNEWVTASALAAKEKEYVEQRAQLTLKSDLELRNSLAAKRATGANPLENLTFEKFVSMFGTGAGTTSTTPVTTGNAVQKWETNFNSIFGDL